MRRVRERTADGCGGDLGIARCPWALLSVSRRSAGIGRDTVLGAPGPCLPDDATSSYYHRAKKKRPPGGGLAIVAMRRYFCIAWLVDGSPVSFSFVLPASSLVLSTGFSRAAR